MTLTISVSSESGRDTWDEVDGADESVVAAAAGGLSCAAAWADRLAAVLSARPGG